MLGLFRKILMSPVTSFLSELPSGKEGVIQTLNIMSDQVKQYKSDTNIRRLAVALCGPVNGNQKNYKKQVFQIFQFVQHRIGYIRDIHGVETIQTPVYTLNSGTGDCDDKSTLLATLLACVGFPTRFFAMGFAPNSYSHVICEVYLNNQWVSLDATENKPMGWRPPNIVCGYYVENTL